MELYPLAKAAGVIEGELLMSAFVLTSYSRGLQRTNYLSTPLFCWSWVWQPGVNTGEKDPPRDDSARGLLGVCDCSRDKLPLRIKQIPGFQNCPSDDKVIHTRERSVSRRRGDARDSARAVAIHCVSSRVKTGYDGSRPSC